MAKLTKDLPTQISLRLENDLVALLEADAKANGRTVSQSIRLLLRQALDPQYQPCPD